jgi:hypothetical protein
MIAVMTGTEYAPEEKKSQLMVLFCLRVGCTCFSVLTFILLASWSAVVYWLRRRDTPSSDTLTWFFVVWFFRSAFLLIARTINVCFNERMNEEKKVDNDCCYGVDVSVFVLLFVAVMRIVEPDDRSG